MLDETKVNLSSQSGQQDYLYEITALKIGLSRLPRQNASDGKQRDSEADLRHTAGSRINSPLLPTNMNGDSSALTFASISP